MERQTAGFPSSVRLRSRQQFTVVQNQGRRVVTRSMTVLALPNDKGQDRLGVIASRRLGGAVVRNRAKRRLREIFRQTRSGHESEGPRPALDVVAIARRELVALPLSAVQADFALALRKLRGAAR